MKRASKHLNNPVTVYLENGVKLTGIITDVDEEGFTLTRDEVGQEVFHHAVATIMPGVQERYRE